MGKISHSPSHAGEVFTFGRFEVGRKWTSFLWTCIDVRIARAKKSLRNTLGSDPENLTFLDVGLGSGLVSPTLLRAGVCAYWFELDPNFGGDANWQVEIVRVLDNDNLSKRCQVDIRYVWRALNHFGQMWIALAKLSTSLQDSWFVPDPFRTVGCFLAFVEFLSRRRVESNGTPWLPAIRGVGSS